MSTCRIIILKVQVTVCYVTFNSSVTYTDFLTLLWPVSSREMPCHGHCGGWLGFRFLPPSWMTSHPTNHHKDHGKVCPYYCFATHLRRESAVEYRQLHKIVLQVLHSGTRCYVSDPGKRDLRDGCVILCVFIHDFVTRLRAGSTGLKFLSTHHKMKNIAAILIHFALSLWFKRMHMGGD